MLEYCDRLFQLLTRALASGTSLPLAIDQSLPDDCKRSLVYGLPDYQYNSRSMRSWVSISETANTISHDRPTDDGAPDWEHRV